MLFLSYAFQLASSAREKEKKASLEADKATSTLPNFS